MGSQISDSLSTRRTPMKLSWGMVKKRCGFKSGIFLETLKSFKIMFNNVYCSLMCLNDFYFSNVLIVILWHFEFFTDFKFLQSDEKHLGMELSSGKYKST